MKYILFLFLALITLNSSAQTEFDLSEYYGKKLSLTNGWFGTDTINITVLTPVDTVGIYFSEEKLIAYKEYTRTTGFELDSIGQIINFRRIIQCPIGEQIPNLTRFDIKDNRIFVCLEYKLFGDSKNAPIVHNYIYKIEKMTDKKMLLSLLE